MPTCSRLLLTRRSLPLATLLTVLTVASSRPAQAQFTDGIIPSAMDLGTPLSGPGGLAIYGISGFAGYARFNVPGQDNSGGPVSFFTGGSSPTFGGAITGGWSRKWRRSEGNIIYNMSYSNSPEFTQINGFGHQLRVMWNAELARKWRFAFSGNSSILNLQESLFQPEVLTVVQGPIPTFQDLSSAAAAGQFTNSQIASLLTGAPILESPSAILLFGQKRFTNELSTSLAYAPTTRLQVNLYLTGIRSQHWGSGGDLPQGAVYLPAMTTAQVGLGVNYSLTPRTQIGLSSAYGRTYSTFESAQTSSNTVTLSRRTGRHWNLSAFGGYGHITPIASRQIVNSGPQYLAGGSVTYKSRDHVLIGSYSHTISNMLSYGVQTAHIFSGGWTWRKPGRNWTASSQFSYQNSDPSVDSIGQTSGLFAQARIARRLSSTLTLSGQLAYFKNNTRYGSTSPQDTTSYFNGTVTRVILTWHPAGERHGRDQQQLPGS